MLTLKQSEFSKRWPFRTSFFACPSFTVSEIASASFLAFFARQSTAVSAKRYTNARLYIYARLYICTDNPNPFAQYRILWTGSLKMHTLHVIDACRACWHAATRLPPNPAGALFNVADQGDTDQGGRQSEDHFFCIHDLPPTGITLPVFLSQVLVGSSAMLSF